jgi:hypothetical protein
MLIDDGLTVHGIASQLNSKGIAYTGDSKWDYQAVYGVLTHPKYVGCHVYGRTSCRLYTPSVNVPKKEWILTYGAFEPVVEQGTFLQAQAILADRTLNKSDEELLNSLRTLLAREGRLSLHLIKDSSDVPSPSTYRHRFGSLRRAYQLIGYGRTEQFGSIDLRRRTQALRDELVARIAELFSNEVTVVRRNGRWRTVLRLRNGRLVSVVIARSIRVWKETRRWQIDPVWRERMNITLLARLDEGNQSFFDFHLLPNIDRPRRFHICHADRWLGRGVPLDDLSEFCTLLRRCVLRDNLCDNSSGWC